MALASTVAAATHNAADLDISSAYNIPVPFINTGGLFVINGGSIAGNITDATVLSVGQDSHGDLSPVNLTMAGAIGGVPIIHVYPGSSFIANNVVSGVTNNLTVDAGSEATFNSLLIGSGVLNNNGTVTLGANNYTRMTGGINNANELNILGSFKDPNSVVNTGTVNLVGSTSAIVGDISFVGTLGIVAKDYTPITTISGPDIINVAIDAIFRIPVDTSFTLNSSLAGAGSVVNAGVLNLASNAKLNMAVTGSGSIVVNNNVVLAIANDLNAAASSFINHGVINFVGNRNINVGSYSAPGTQNFTITSPGVYDSLTSSSSIDLSDGTVNIISDYHGCHNQYNTWDIITGASIVTNSNTAINIPESGYFHKWHSSVNATAITIDYTHTAFVSETPAKYADMAAAMDYMLAHGTADERAMLAQSLAACGCHAEYLAALDKLQPSLNVQSSHVAVQNATLNKAEMRVSGLRDASPPIPGIAYGDINPTTSLWLAGFGSIANQKQTATISGYRATAAGGLLGFDRKCNDGRIFGVALGYSNSNVDGDLSTDSNTRIIGYHALAYGSNDINENNFYEWLATGITNLNNGSRLININNTNWSVTTDYHTLQGGVRFNLGQYIDFDGWRFSQIETARYTLLYQPSYDEVGSPAALHVQPQAYNSILTFGGGYRLAWTGHDAWAVGSRELRALVTYDAITSDNVTTASFIAGSPDFTVSNSASRWALQLGADYAFTFYDKLQLQISYDFELRNQYTDNSAEIRFRYLF